MRHRAETFYQRAVSITAEADLIPRLMDLTRDQVLSWDDDHWDEQLRGSALRRIKPWMWRRNAAAARMSEPPTI